jgi:acyl-CoA hydrolase
MPYLTTGLLDNATVEGVRRSSTLSVNLSNDDTSTVAIQVEGFFQSETTKVKYVEEFFTLTAGTVALKNYFVPFNAFEFVFFVSSEAVEVSVWSKDANGKPTSDHLVVVEASA